MQVNKKFVSNILNTAKPSLIAGKAKTANLRNYSNWRNRMRILLILILCWLNGVVHAQALRDGAGGRTPAIYSPTLSFHTNGHTRRTIGDYAINHYPHHFYRDDYWPAPYYPSNGTSSSLDGYGWSAAPPAFSYIAAREPDPEWTPMFSNKAVRTKVVGTSIVSMRNSAGGSYIFVGPGRRNGKSSEEFTSSVKDLPPPNTISWSK